jgi:predicted RNase H-like HicB family nuclease
MSETLQRSMIVVPICIESDDAGFVGYSPDLCGCVVSGETREEVRELLLEAVRLNLASYVKHGDPLPSGCHLACAQATCTSTNRLSETEIRVLL